ncbi:hypothetical protein B296_00033020 [Ensete ventricosum]|uniref:Uncharacterized protein n=1 Tax=Ensete ventricosum TaxID=4639 RepID=A0A427AC57_ENSVE|nr:hypothetical protein B296_00033020 [Ensete ventricosum]
MATAGAGRTPPPSLVFFYKRRNRSSGAKGPRSGGHGHVGDARRPQTCCTRNAAGAVAGTRLIPYMSLYAETQPWNAL